MKRFALTFVQFFGILLIMMPGISLVYGVDVSKGGDGTQPKTTSNHAIENSMMTLPEPVLFYQFDTTGQYQFGDSPYRVADYSTGTQNFDNGKQMLYDCGINGEDPGLKFILGKENVGGTERFFLKANPTAGADAGLDINNSTVRSWLSPGGYELDGTVARTISFWLKLDNVVPTDAGAGAQLLTLGSPFWDKAGDGLSIYLGKADGKRYLEIKYGSGDDGKPKHTFKADFDFADDTWYNIAVRTPENGTLLTTEVLVNGVVVSNHNDPLLDVPVNISDKLFAWLVPWRNQGVSLADVRFYNQFLTDLQIKIVEHIDALPEPVLFYQFDTTGQSQFGDSPYRLADYSSGSPNFDNGKQMLYDCGINGDDPGLKYILGKENVGGTERYFLKANPAAGAGTGLDVNNSTVRSWLSPGSYGLDGTVARTISFWLKLDNVVPTDAGAGAQLLTLGSPFWDKSGDGLSIYLGKADGKRYLEIKYGSGDDGTPKHTFKTNFDFADDTWYNIAVRTPENGTLLTTEVLVNGVVESTQNDPLLDVPVNIGNKLFAWLVPWRNQGVSLADVRFYNQFLTDSQIRRTEHIRALPDPSLYYSFDTTGQSQFGDSPYRLADYSTGTQNFDNGKQMLYDCGINGEDPGLKFILGKENVGGTERFFLKANPTAGADAGLDVNNSTVRSWLSPGGYGLDGTVARTISFWLKLDNVVPTDAGAGAQLLTLGSPFWDKAGDGLSIYLGKADGKRYLEIKYGSGDDGKPKHTFRADFDFADDTWYNIAVRTPENGTLLTTEVLVNGVVVSTQNDPLLDVPVNIGDKLFVWLVPWRNQGVSLAEVLFYNQYLTDGQIRDIANTTDYVANTDASLLDLSVNGTTLTDFAPVTLNYAVLLPFGTINVPNVTYLVADAYAFVKVTNATNLGGTEAERTTSVLVTAQDGITNIIYTIVYTVDDNIGIAKTSVSGISVFPNPVTDQLTIRGLAKVNRVEILDITGKMLQKMEVTGDEVSLNVSNLHSGMYFLRTEGHVVKFIKK